MIIAVLQRSSTISRGLLYFILGAAGGQRYEIYKRFDTILG